jgi:hypothetical protein
MPTLIERSSRRLRKPLSLDGPMLSLTRITVRLSSVAAKASQESKRFDEGGCAALIDRSILPWPD